MRILVTGALGKVGAATVDALVAAGHDVTGTDVARPVFEAGVTGSYVQAELTDAGDAYAVVRGHNAVIHAAALPEPTRNPPHVVFQNNLMSVFNTLEAAIAHGVTSFVNVSSETVPGMIFAARPFVADYAPIDEEHPVRPQDPYATAKHFSELLMDGATRRSDLRAVSIRPSYVTWEGNYADGLGAALTRPSEPSASFWSYIDVHDLADALRLAAEAELDTHEVFFIASPDNTRGEPLRELIARHHSDAVRVRDLERPDASGISIAKARRLLGYAPTRSWRDYLDDGGALKPDVAERLARGDTAVQRGRALLTPR